MCTNTYSNRERFDKIIAKIKWCSFFAPQCIVTTGTEELGAILYLYCSATVALNSYRMQTVVPTRTY